MFYLEKKHADNQTIIALELPHTLTAIIEYWCHLGLYGAPNQTTRGHDPLHCSVRNTNETSRNKLYIFKQQSISERKNVLCVRADDT